MPATRGGATERSWHGLARLFAAAGHAVTFISRRVPGMPATEVADGVRHVRIAGFDHSRHLAANLLMDLVWGLRVRRVLPPGDVLVCNTVTLPAWLGRTRHPCGTVAVMIGRTPKGQVPFYRRVDRIYAPSTAVARAVGPGEAGARTRVIGYPIDWGLLAGASAQGAPPVVVGYVGRLHPEKGLPLLIRAAGRLAGRGDLPDWRLRIMGPSAVGDGGGGDGWISALKRDAAAAGPRVEWRAPEFDPAGLARAYGAIDVFCYPSLAERGETFGVAVAEAMAAGCAVVVSKLGCFADLVTDGETGLVFDHASADADLLLAEKLALLVRDARLRTRLAAGGRERAARFDFPAVSEALLNDFMLLTGAAAQGRQS